MSLVNTSRPETSSGEVVTVFRRAIAPGLASDIASTALELLVENGWNLEEAASRGFRKSSILPIANSIPVLGRIARELLVAPLPSSTLRINWQETGGKQGWHQDYIPEPIVVYPLGEGCLDIALGATDLRDARNAQANGGVNSVKIGAGDIALVHRGGEVFHRGRNVSTEEPRITIVMH